MGIKYSLFETSSKKHCDESSYCLNTYEDYNIIDTVNVEENTKEDKTINFEIKGVEVHINTLPLSEINTLLLPEINTLPLPEIKDVEVHINTLPNKNIIEVSKNITDDLINESLENVSNKKKKKKRKNKNKK